MECFTDGLPFASLPVYFKSRARPKQNSQLLPWTIQCSLWVLAHPAAAELILSNVLLQRRSIYHKYELTSPCEFQVELLNKPTGLAASPVTGPSPVGWQSAKGTILGRPSLEHAHPLKQFRIWSKKAL